MSDYGTSPDHADSYWVSIADLMSGLMVLFLFIGVAYMSFVSKQQKQIRQVAVAWEESKGQLYKKLQDEFAHDLPKWNAEIDSVSLSVRFKEPDVLFEPGSAVVRPKFQEILSDFFPRYSTIVRSFGDQVDEIRIEGHTSSEGPSANPYYYNMQLSQDRTRAVLVYCLERSGISAESRSWVMGRMTANGLSSSKLVVDSASGLEDRNRSRRVEFRVRTNSEVRIAEILQATK